MSMSELTFDAESHTYRLDGVVLPSVTQVLKPLYDFRGIDPDVLNAKAALGTAVHRACELHDNNDLDEESEEGRAALAPLAGYLAGYRKFLAEKRPEVIHNEQRMHHPGHLFAGTLDRRYFMEGHLWDVDLKSTVAMSPIVGVQVAAYTAMQTAAGASHARRGALQLFPDGKYKLHEFRERNDWPTFLSLLTVRRFKERHGIEI